MFIESSRGSAVGPAVESDVPSWASVAAGAAASAGTESCSGAATSGAVGADVSGSPSCSWTCRYGAAGGASARAARAKPAAPQAITKETRTRPVRMIAPSQAGCEPQVGNPDLSHVIVNCAGIACKQSDVWRHGY